MKFSKLVMAAVAVYGCWALFVYLWSGWPFGGDRWTIEQFGQFGDSFGPIGAAMASLAALFTWRALLHERELSAKTSAEQTFFRLLDTRREKLREVNYLGYRGVAAFEEWRNLIVKGDTKKEITSSYKLAYADGGTSLQNYFRVTYHAVALVRDRFSKEEAYRYVQILRAELTTHEQFMIGINAANGFPKMLKLVNDWSLLHALPKNDWDLLRTNFDTLQITAWKTPSEMAGEKN